MYPNTVVIDASGSSTYYLDTLWICGGLDVTIAGSLNGFFIENNASVTLTGSYNSGFVKSGTTLVLEGDSCAFGYEAGATVIDNGTQNTVYACLGAVTFDYTNAPPNGCTGIGFDEQAPAALSVQLAPNPADGVMQVMVTGGTVSAMVALDQSGREVLRAPGGLQPSIDVSTLEAGNYVLRIETDQGTVIEKFTRR